MNEGVFMGLYGFVWIRVKGLVVFVMRLLGNSVLCCFLKVYFLWKGIVELRGGSLVKCVLDEEGFFCKKM